MNFQNEILLTICLQENLETERQENLKFSESNQKLQLEIDLLKTTALKEQNDLKQQKRFFENKAFQLEQNSKLQKSQLDEISTALD